MTGFRVNLFSASLLVHVVSATDCLKPVVQMKGKDLNAEGNKE